MKLTDKEYNILSDFAFSENNEGYKPEIIESPNGDNIWDNNKKYAHIAPKYFKTKLGNEIDSVLYEQSVKIYYKCIDIANTICSSLDLPKNVCAGNDSTLRILDYPPGAVTAPHTDFNLFTLSMYRDDINAFKYLNGEDDELLKKARKISTGIHFGEIMTEINGATATEHEVIATNDQQKSAVFFVVPDHNLVLPSGDTVGQWMNNRKSRSRKVK